MMRIWVARLTYHGKIIVGSAILALALAFFVGVKPLPEMLILLFCLLFALFEVSLLLAPIMLSNKGNHIGKGIITTILYKLVVFYVCLLFISFVVTLAVMAVFYFLRGENVLSHLRHFFGPGLKNFLTYYVVGMTIGAICYFFFLWRDTLHREQRLQQEKLQFRLETLKSQVNPHFLFNSLNTLSSLVSANAALSEQFIQKLSSIYQYILEHSEAESVSLTAELNFVRDYFYLQQIRDGNKITLSIQADHAPQYKILPISVQLLVENSLKHNLATSERQLSIVIEITDGCVVVKNNLQRKDTIERSKKIGLNNLQERVRYATGRDIKVVETREEFAVFVPLIG
jgi:two-component system LytT family sensor kinase